MHYYLSSYLLGNQLDYLKQQALKYPRITYISNAMDISGLDQERLDRSNQQNIDGLTKLGFEVTNLDLKDYFKDNEKLKFDLNQFDGIFIRGGNVFALRQAMKLSGLDNILIEYNSAKKDFFYMGYSAGICVLTPTLRGIELVDPIDNSLHSQQSDLIWEGLGILDFSIAPHYRSDHHESEMIEKLVEYYIENKILFKALKDGEVLIIE